jgi:hypothetical protein
MNLNRRDALRSSSQKRPTLNQLSHRSCRIMCPLDPAVSSMWEKDLQCAKLSAQCWWVCLPFRVLATGLFTCHELQARCQQLPIQGQPGTCKPAPNTADGHDDTTLPSVFLNLKLLGTKICFPFESELRGGADMPTSRELWRRGLDELAAGCSESFFLELPDRYFQRQRYGIANLGGYTIVITELSTQLPAPSTVRCNDLDLARF